MIEEKWKDIEGYEGLYQVSNLGNIKSLERKVLCKNGEFKTIHEKNRKPFKDKDEYLGLTLSKNGKLQTIKVHREVAKAFIPNNNNKEQVNHIDGNKNNNIISNLEWCTNQENRNHAIKNGLANQRGEHNPMSKLTLELAKEIRELYRKDKNKYKIKVLADMFGVCFQNIHGIITYRTWKEKNWGTVKNGN